jgi:hypothetical protein
VPYLNRALAEEQLGVNAASSGNKAQADQHYQAALRVSLPTGFLHDDRRVTLSMVTCPSYSSCSKCVRSFVCGLCLVCITVVLK